MNPAQRRGRKASNLSFLIPFSRVAWIRTTRSMRTVWAPYACHSMAICLMWMSLTLSSPEVSRGSFFSRNRNLLFDMLIRHPRWRISFCSSFSKKSTHEVVSCFSHKMRCFFSYIEHKRGGLCRLELNFWKINILKIIFESFKNIRREI
jgi:hypothetical protein